MFGGEVGVSLLALGDASLIDRVPFLVIEIALRTQDVGGVAFGGGEDISTVSADAELTAMATHTASEEGAIAGANKGAFLLDGLE